MEEMYLTDTTVREALDQAGGTPARTQQLANELAWHERHPSSWRKGKPVPKDFSSKAEKETETQ